MRKLVPVFAAALVAGVAAPAAQAGTITALGAAQVDVTPTDRNNNASIVDAVERAEQLGIPKALRAARIQAKELAAASNLTLGALVSIEQNVGGPGYGYSGPYGALAPFGPNKYCGTITRRRRHRTPSGQAVTETTKTRRCYVPRRLPVQLAVTFEATPAS